MDYILGVDGGGTKTFVQITDISGKVISESKYGSSNFKSVGIKAARENISKAILKAIKSINHSNKFTFKYACLGLAGNDTPMDDNTYRKIIFDSDIKDYMDPAHTITCNDTRVGLAAGSNSKNRIIIICGTGSSCFGINEEGKEAKANGWDYILGDEGSGYDIGLNALRACIRAYDGRGEKTLLSVTILEDLGIKSITELVDWAYSGTLFNNKIAALARTVCATAEKGDKISAKILKEAALEAVNSINAVVNKLNLADKVFDLVFVGKVFKCEKYFKSIVMEKIKNKFIKVNFVPLSEEPVQGAIKLALKNL